MVLPRGETIIFKQHHELKFGTCKRSGEFHRDLAAEYTGNRFNCFLPLAWTEDIQMGDMSWLGQCSTSQGDNHRFTRYSGHNPKRSRE